MKKFLFLIITTVVLAACGNSETKEETATTAPAETTPAATPAGQMDPICKMEREKGWTDHAVSATGDTTWFCSTTCKDVFVARNK